MTNDYIIELFQNFNPRGRKDLDEQAVQLAIEYFISIHKAAKTSTKLRAGFIIKSIISIHEAAKTSTDMGAAAYIAIAFQSTRPQRPRHGATPSGCPYY